MTKLTIEYCSKYQRYNGKPVTEGKVLAPFIVSDHDYKTNDSIIKKNLRTWTFYGASFRIGFMVVPKEDFPKMIQILNSEINFYFSEHPGLRPGRCLMGIGTDGLPILCSKENRCKGCPHHYEGLPRYKNLEDFYQHVSFDDVLKDAEGNIITPEPEDPEMGPEDVALEASILSDLMNFLEEKKPRYKSMIQHKREGFTPEEIIAAEDLQKSFGYKELGRAMKFAEEFLNNY